MSAPPSTAYDHAGEFYELVAQRQVRRSGPAVAAALTGLDPSAGPVLEIGAGTGAITEVIAAAVPGVEIEAAEPATTMRAVLTARVAGDPDLAARVSITPETAQQVAARLRARGHSAAVLLGVVGHLEDTERAALWAGLARTLAPGAPVVVELMGVTAPRVIAPTRLLRERIGEQTYEWWSGGEPEHGRMRFDTVWRVLDTAGRCVREVAESYPWATQSAAEVAAESGFVLDPPGPVAEVVVLRVPQDTTPGDGGR